MDKYRMQAVVKSVRLRTTHRYGYRTGEWGTVVGVCMVTPEGKEPRLCYAVRYDDGFTDYKAIEGMKEDFELEAI